MLNFTFRQRIRNEAIGKEMCVGNSIIGTIEGKSLWWKKSHPKDRRENMVKEILKCLDLLLFAKKR